MPDNTYRVIVTGSRHWLDTVAIHRRIAVLPENTVLVHGDARGADRIAEREARRRGFLVESHPANWRLYGKRAGILRNAEMVALGAELCLAFPGPESLGTWDCVRRCEAAGIPVWIHQEAE